MAPVPDDERWRPGEVIVRREVLNDGRVWAKLPQIVVLDEPGLLATYIAEGAPLRFPEGDWPTPTGRHPWHGKARWRAPGVLELQRPGDPYAVRVFWSLPPRRFRGWYVNFQDPLRRTTIGYDTQDLELDMWLPAGGRPELKDEDLLEQRVREGRFTPDQAEETREHARRLMRDLEAGRRWWSDSWAEWEPDPGWPTPGFPA